MEASHFWTGDPRQDDLQARAHAAQCQARGMMVDVQPHPHGGLIVQAWYPQPSAAAAPAMPPGYPAGPYAGHQAPAPAAPLPAPAAPPKRPSAFVRLMRFAASEPKGFNVVGIVAALLVAGPTYAVAWYTRLDPLIAFAIAAPLAVVLTVGSALIAKIKGFKVFAAAFVAALTSVVPMLWTIDGKNALVVVDNRSDKSLYLFADGERIAEVRGHEHEVVAVDIRSEKVGWGRSKSKAKTSIKVTLDEGDHYLLTPKGGRCYLMVTTSYSLTGLDDPVNDKVAWLPDEVWQRLSPAPNVEFADNPQTITTEMGADNPVSRALRRSLACSTLATCASIHKKVLEACYSASSGEDDFKACNEEAKTRCGD